MKLKDTALGTRWAIFLAAMLLCLFTDQPSPAQKAVAATPPMGWNSWNHFAGKVTDKDVRAAADALVATGMRDAGYVYVNIDDTWEGTRDAHGVIQTNEKFPDMKALADYVHSKGLKLGIYSSPGPKTCAGYEGSYGHEEQDAATYAAWGIDYVKYDLCGYRDIMNRESHGDAAKANTMMHDAYEKMHRAITKTGRPMFYSLCQYGWDAVWEWGPDVGANSWRTTGDISDNYDRMSVIGFAQAGLEKFAAPGHWNDPDMLEVGNGGMTADEYRTHMTLWAMLAAPLLAGNDLSRMSADTRSILMNRDVIAVDQDVAGQQGTRVWAEGPKEIWTKALENGGTAVALFNRGESTLPVTLRVKDVGLRKGLQTRNVWQGSEIRLVDEQTFLIPTHGVVLLVVH
jgi:alpha-galactosidase